MDKCYYSNGDLDIPAITSSLHVVSDIPATTSGLPAVSDIPAVISGVSTEVSAHPIAVSGLPVVPDIPAVVLSAKCNRCFITVFSATSYSMQHASIILMNLMLDNGLCFGMKFQ